tara:strand:- start:4142 stop:6871 length:2730 start_codon:yes stop_codon:yes gene_type:complete
MLKFQEQAGQVVFTFGRFNPPTTGHEKLLDRVKLIAGTGRYVIYPSQSQNQKKDPLPFALKVAYMKKMFPTHARNILADKKIINVFDIAVKLYNEKYTDIAMVVGSDRVKEFKTLLDKYNDVKSRHGYYKFRTISVISAGERDPDAEGVTGMSASKMRASASQGDFESFKLGLPKGFKDGQKLFNDVRKFMGIREERDMGLMTDYEELRDAYLTGDVWNINDTIVARGIQGKIINRGTNYVSFVDESNKVHKAWLHEINVHENPFAGGMLDPSPLVRKLKGKLDSRIISKVIKKYKDGVDKGKDKGGSAISGGKNSKNRLIFDIVRQFGLETKYGMNTRGIAKFINKLVSKGKLDKKYVVEAEKIRRVRQDKDVKGSPGSEPAKYFAKGAGGKGMSKSTKQARARHFDKGAAMSDDDPRAYEPAPGDKGKKTKPSKYTKKFKKMYGEEEMELDEKIAGLVKKSKQTGVPYGTLKKSYDRGMAAWRTGHRPGTTPQQWAFARVNSMLSGGKADPDLQKIARAAKKRKKASKKESFMNINTVQEWFESNITRAKYQLNHGEDWWWKMNEVHDKMLEKIDADCCDDCINEEMKPEDSLKNWEHDDAKGYAEKLIKEYGQPDEVTETMLKWNKLGSFGEGEMETYIVDESIPHSFPKPHRDYVYTVMNIKVDSDMLDTLGHVTGSIIYDGLKETVTARCGSLYANAATMGFVRDMVDGKVPVEDGPAKKEYADRITKDPLPKFYDNRMNESVEHMCGHCLEESLWANIHKKRQRIKQGSGEKMRKPGEKGAPTPAQLKRAKGEGYQKFNQFVLRNHWGEVTEKAEYQGRPVELNNPTRGDTKKFKVYVRNDKGNVVKVEYGDPNMEIKRDDPARRKSFRARHNCDNPGPKYKARYWSCKFWSAKKSVTDLMKG